ncbi:23S rRNA (guanosine(2251)-2'-O)-methyltransferase RlmB [Desulfurobacterium atlanticum]|uniref:23S rRNA (Guanosine2251-2'-O)-methyltransferase n=1 Tax=Desulfurobacterium atlanticum TaxID=240169 RepID=A0A238Z8F7_9BACT|nr:23S rRNA (guanosine(2251)-2'-O)-methyltransferase RlmB [Desulfurobacterium atlanticum]SNR79349.1 23S rRNA (guanosine2251-2'-O)-methyltransferase [Desulfurobacterium atlanticum]
MVIYGVNPVIEALRAGYPVLKVYIEDSFRHKEILERLKKERIKTVKVGRKKLTEISGTEKHQGIVAVVSPVEPVSFEELAERTVATNGCLLFLDRIEDPHNLGAIFRSADAFGITGIVIPKDRSVTITDTVVKASTGAVFYVPFSVVGSFRQSLFDFRECGGWLVGLESRGKDISNYKFPFPLGLVAGSEGKGISKPVKKILDDIVTIPMKGHVNSLNVSNAVAIGLYLISIQK